MALPKIFEEKYYKAHCNHCGEHMEFPASSTGEMIICPHCARPTALEPFTETAVEILSHKPHVDLTIGALVGQSRQLLAVVSAQETSGRSRVISAPSLIATDSIAATINVGVEVPTLTATATTGLQQGGSSIFANSVSNRNSGVTLSVVARVNPSGIVTLVINQEVSAPQPPPTNAAIQSPSFSKRTIQTQVTVNDGDTIAIGGISNEDDTSSSSGIPGLHRRPGLGALFGHRAYDKNRTELIVFMTPRVIYDSNQITEASDELKSRMRRLQKYIRE
jgi:general secretion pathway protein D